MTDDVRNIRIEDYDYPLTDDRIALHPLEDRDKCRLLHWCAGSGISDRVFCELPDLLPADSVLVYNNTRVIMPVAFRKKGREKSWPARSTQPWPHRPAPQARER